MRKILGILLVVLFCFPIFQSNSYGQNNHLQAGVAVVDMCPPVGVPLAGYGGGKRRLDFPDMDPDNYHTFLAPSDGILDRLVAKTLVLKSGKNKIAIIKVDAIGASGKLVRDIVKKIQPVTGIDVDHVTLTGTHTHSGPGAIAKGLFWEIAAADAFDHRIYDPLVEKIANAIIEADKNLAPVTLGIGTQTTFQLSRNRRGHTGVIDPVIGVFRIDHIDGTPMAVLYNFAVHGTCYGADNLKMSADVMGYSERHIERVMAAKKTPVHAFFINGTEGDVSPKQGKGDGAKIVGEGLGQIVLNTRDSITTMRTNVPIKVANLQLPFKKAHLNLELWDGKDGEIDCWGIRELLYKHLPNQRFKIKVEITDMVPMEFRIQAIRIGDAVIGCIPGEPLTNIGKMVKSHGVKAGFSNTFIFGLANGHMGYLCDKENFDEGGYEAMMNLFGREAGELVAEKLGEMFEQLKD